MKIKIEWTDDCSGKKDYDGDVVRVSTRYWPRGGGFLEFGPDGFKDNDARPEIKPSAKSHILFGDEDLATAEFEGETEAEVKAEVEAWVAAQLARIESAMRAAFTT